MAPDDPEQISTEPPVTAYLTVIEGVEPMVGVRMIEMMKHLKSEPGLDNLKMREIYKGKANTIYRLRDNGIVHGTRKPPGPTNWALTKHGERCLDAIEKGKTSVFKSTKTYKEYRTSAPLRQELKDLYQALDVVMWAALGEHDDPDALFQSLQRKLNYLKRHGFPESIAQDITESAQNSFTSQVNNGKEMVTYSKG